MHNLYLECKCPLYGRNVNSGSVQHKLIFRKRLQGHNVTLKQGPTLFYYSPQKSKTERGSRHTFTQTHTSFLPDRPRRTHCSRTGPERARTHRLCGCLSTPSHSAVRWLENLKTESVKKVSICAWNWKRMKKVDYSFDAIIGDSALSAQRAKRAWKRWRGSGTFRF